MTDNCKTAVEQYVKALAEGFEVQETEGGCIVVTPYVRRDNDLIEIGVERQPDGRFLVTDYGETLAYLNLSGVNISRSPEVKRTLAQIGKRFRVEIAEDDISAFASDDALGPALENVINAVVDAAYLVYKRRRHPPVSFDERVEKLLISEGFTYDSTFPVRGKTEVHRFRFHVNSRSNSLIEPLTATSGNSALAKAERLAFRWLDIVSAEIPYQKIVIVDDEGPKTTIWTGRPIEVLSGYSDAVILWSGVSQLAGRLRTTRLI